MRNIFIFFLLIISLSCGSSNVPLSPKEQFDKLEKIFSNDNWRVTGKTDTAYWYFSRLGDVNYSVYDFRMEKGDSALSSISFIINKPDAIIWTRPSDTLKLVFADSASVSWNTLNDDKKVFTFKKISDNNISLELPGGEKLLMTKTLPFATFLVRSKYDYINNTHTIDSPLVPHRGKPIGN